MDNASARRLVEQTFQAAFDKPQFATFASELLKRFEFRPAQVSNIPLAYRPTYVEAAERIGTYTSPTGDLVLVIAVHLARDTTLFRARTALRDFAGYLLDRERADAALIAFVPPDGTTWRFSYVKLELSASLGASGRASLTKEVSPARRLSFLVGAQESCHTAKTRFLGLLTSDVPPEVVDIEEAFNVESVTQEFFDEYKELFLRTKESIEELSSRDRTLRDELRTHRVDPIDLAKKLLGQIVFLYFIQKKGWLGVTRDGGWGSGPHDFLKRLYAGEYARFDNFFDDVLEPLFYESLAADRDGAWDAQLNCRIPFLNGGLFEPLHGYDWRRTKILLPNALFHNTEVNASGDVGTGILDVFNRYNFTVNEAEPLEKEVAIDPEMLGKVFENLLDVRERKSKGSFYTPREIVHYMCQEALINFLDNIVNGPETTPIVPPSPSQDGLFGESVPRQTALAISTRRAVIPRDELATFVRNGDQAALREVVRKEGSKSYARELPKSIEKHAALLDGALGELHVCDPAIGSGAFVVGMMTEVVRARTALNAYLGSAGRTAYDFKRHAIHHSLYGVDIDAGAVEIAKLRLWLSLVVDEIDATTIKPLPNLDYKIVAGNSLLGFPFQSAGMRQVEFLKDELTVTSDATRKAELRRTIDREIQRHLAGSEKALGHRVDFDFRVFFSEVFAAGKGGFDIVIANPPYVSAWDMPTDGPDGRRALERRFSRFKVLEGHWDLYVAFIIQGFDVLSDHGVLTFVLPNPVLREKYARKLRRHVLNERQLSSILTFQETNMFKNVSRKTVVLVIDTSPKHSTLVPLFRFHEQANGEGYIELDRELDTTLWRADLSAQFRIDATEDLDAIAIRMESSGLRLGDACYVNYGAQLASKEKGAFKKKDIISTQPRGNAKPFYDGKDLQRWNIQSRHLFVDYRKAQLYGPRTERLFEAPKIAIRNISDAGHRVAGTLDTSGQYCDHTVVLAVHYAEVAGSELRASFEGFQQLPSPPPLEFIAAALLSKPTTFYYRLKNSNESLQQATSHVFPQQLRALPLPIAAPSVVREVVALVRELMTLRPDDPRRSEIDQELDAVMFKLYGVAADRDAIEAFLTSGTRSVSRSNSGEPVSGRVS
jgi:hypothetical protein